MSRCYLEAFPTNQSNNGFFQRAIEDCREESTKGKSEKKSTNKVERERERFQEKEKKNLHRDQTQNQHQQAPWLSVKN
jgi:hypothetical protein